MLKYILSIGFAVALASSLSAQPTAPGGAAPDQAVKAKMPSKKGAEMTPGEITDAYMVEAVKIFTANQANPKKRIPDEVLAEADAVMIMRIKRGAIGIGAAEGKGIATKNNIDNWSPPAFYKLGSGSLGLQIGASQSDVIVLFMNAEATQELFKQSFQWGVGLVAEAGPIGGDASLNTWKEADMLVYDTRKGLSVGVKISGGSLVFDQALNDAEYDKEGITAEAILGSTVTMPPEAKELTDLLREYSFVNTQPENAKSAPAAPASSH